MILKLYWGVGGQPETETDIGLLLLVVAFDKVDIVLRLDKHGHSLEAFVVVDISPVQRSIFDDKGCQLLVSLSPDFNLFQSTKANSK